MEYLKEHIPHGIYENKSPSPLETSFLLGTNMTNLEASDSDAKLDYILKELQKLIKQNNFTNVYLQTLGQQVTRIEAKLDQILSKIDKTPKDVESIRFKTVTNYIPIKPPADVKGFKLTKGKKEIISALEERFKNTNLQILEETNNSS